MIGQNSIGHWELLADAAEEPGWHQFLPFDVDGSSRFKQESCGQGIMHRLSALDVVR